MGGVFCRCLVEARQHGRFGKAHVLDVLVEIELRCRCRAERATTHVRPVEIQFQDLVLRQIIFQPERQEGFLDLAFQRPLVGQEHVLGELLRDGGPALNDRIGASIFHHRARQTCEIEPDMVEEPAIFRRQHGFDEMVGQFLDRFGIVVQHAPSPDLVAEPVKERDRDLLAGTPVLLGLLERRLGECEQQRRSDDTERKTLACQFEDGFLEPGNAKAPEEDGQVLPRLAATRLGAVHEIVNGRIHPHQKVAEGPFSFRREWITHGRSSGWKGMKRARAAPLATVVPQTDE